MLFRSSEQRKMSLLFVSHDLGVVRFVCNQVAVIYGGNIVEAGGIDSIINRPQHRYTAALLAANPGMPKDDNFSAFIGRRLQTITGSVPAVGRFPSGCRFRNRCQHASDKCVTTPPVTASSTNHRYLCWHPAQGGQS